MLAAAPMHDIGKIGIPDHILLKLGRLDAAEWAVMHTHAEIGARLLEGGGCELLDLASTIAWTHHEQWDGSGYPRGLAGEAIPEAGRICAVANVFDALLAQRPYKRRWTFDEAVDHLRAGAGSQFEPRLVGRFVGQLDAVAGGRCTAPIPERDGDGDADARRASAVTAIARGRDARLQGLAATRPVCLPALVEAELRHGLARRPVHADVRRIVETMLDVAEVRPWHSACARRYGSLRAALEHNGLPLARVGLLIASHAIAEACTLVTADRAFARVPGLQTLDWTADAGH